MPANGASRLDRIEQDLERLVGVVERLASPTQVADGLLARVAEAQLRLAENHNRLEQAQLETTEKLNALIKIVDEWIRNRPQS